MRLAAFFFCIFYFLKKSPVHFLLTVKLPCLIAESLSLYVHDNPERCLKSNFLQCVYLAIHQKEHVHASYVRF